MSEPRDDAPTALNATSWIQSRLTALYAGDVSVQDTFDQTFSPACEVRLDHAVQPLQVLKDALVGRRTAATHASIAWEADIISTNDSDPQKPAVVAGVLVVTRSLPFRIRVSPAQRRTLVHFSARIEHDPSMQDGDRRRLTSFYYTEVDRTPPIHFAVPRRPEETQGGGSGGQ